MHYPQRLPTRIALCLAAAGSVLLDGCHDTIAPPVPVSLAFTVSPPGTVVAGAAIAPAIKVSVLDKDGQVVESAENTITLEIANNPGNATLAGRIAVKAVNGVATFSDISLNRSATGYVLLASSPGLGSATTNDIQVVSGPDARMVFTLQPSSGIANVPIPAFRISVQDANGNTTFASGRQINVQLTQFGAGAVLSGNPNRNVVNGSADFTGLSVTKPGRYSITASSTGMPSVTSDLFDIIIGPPTKLVFLTQPSIARAGEILTPALTVAVKDAGNNTVVAGSYRVSLSLAQNSSGGALGGTTTVSTVDGLATFTDVSISSNGSDYRIIASAPEIPEKATSSNVVIRDGLSWASISAGYFHSCGRTLDGKAYCWGDNFEGQLGMSGNNSMVPMQAAAALELTSISAGRSHTCGLASNGTAYCWGTNALGQIGPLGASGATPVVVSNEVKFAVISAGYGHSCGLDSAGKAYCWGDNSVGELGAPGQTPGFVAVSGGLTFSTITAGRDFTCGITKIGEAYCWGLNSNGEVGDGTTSTRTVPTRVSGNLTFSFVQAGGFHACGLTTEGKAYCWGLNAYGQLGNGQTSDVHSPVAVLGSLTFVSLSVGNRHNCGVTTSGDAYCWGDNSDANLGDGSLTAKSSPTLVGGGIQFTSVSAGRFHSCGTARNNAAYCWGRNGAAQLGDGTTTLRYEPVLVR
jgi:alpha-tubulin suppressor-like RCC1 family protein